MTWDRHVYFPTHPYIQIFIGARCQIFSTLHDTYFGDNQPSCFLSFNQYIALTSEIFMLVLDPALLSHYGQYYVYYKINQSKFKTFDFSIISLNYWTLLQKVLENVPIKTTTIKMCGLQFSEFRIPQPAFLGFKKAIKTFLRNDLISLIKSLWRLQNFLLVPWFFSHLHFDLISHINRSVSKNSHTELPGHVRYLLFLNTQF